MQKHALCRTAFLKPSKSKIFSISNYYHLSISISRWAAVIEKRDKKGEKKVKVKKVRKWKWQWRGEAASDVWGFLSSGENIKSIEEHWTMTWRYSYCKTSWQQLNCPNHDSAFSQCLWLFRERDGAWSEHDVSVLSNPSLKLENLFSMSTLVDPGNHLRMLHNTIALMVRKKELPTECLSIHCILYNVNVGVSLSMWNYVIKLLTGTTVWQNCSARSTIAICLKINSWISASVQLASTGIQSKK